MSGTPSPSGTITQGDRPQGEYDLFLSHATPDKTWVLTLAERLAAMGLRVFVDSLEIDPADNWVIRLSDALQNSRYLVLALSTHTAGRPWVLQEWTSWMAGQGPLGRLLPVRIDAVELPFILKPIQAIDAIDRDAQRAAAELFRVVGDPATLGADDARRLVLGRDRVFTLSRVDDQLRVILPRGEARQIPLPWTQDRRFGIAHLGFDKLHQQAVPEGTERAEMLRHARTLGELLFAALFDAADTQQLEQLIGPDRPRPVIQIRSDDALLLALPWELLYHQDQFLVRAGLVDLLRTTPNEVDGSTLLKQPTAPFKLVVNVSAPGGSKLSYEAESYRITLATADRCRIAPTELGTLTDLVETVHREAPTGIHFSGHGAPGALLFENDEGQDLRVAVTEVLETLRSDLPDAQRLPPFFYLASCHGNDPTDPEQDRPGAASAAVQLHRAGVTEVVGYFGPIVDALSTRAEEALYEAIAEELPTRDAVRRARKALARPLGEGDGHHRPGVTQDGDGAGQTADPSLATDPFPFAWAQLVFYRRGPEWPLSLASAPGKRRATRALRRTFTGFGSRKVLSAGFIGRRAEQHRVRRRLRRGERVLVFQGLGGLGKTTLAQQVLPWLTQDPAQVCTLWCQEVEGAPNRAEALVDQLLAYCRERFGLDWEGVVQQVDRAAGADPARRFALFLQVLLRNAPTLVLYLDNLESLLVGPSDTNQADTEAAAFGDWAEPALEAIWQIAQQLAQNADNAYLVASCRYRNPAFGDALLPIGPLPLDALFRLTEWFPQLNRLSTRSRARLVDRLDGHPRAVEYADDLVADALRRWRDTQGTWVLPEPPTPEDLDREWQTLVEPALPQVAKKLTDNLLLRAIWDRVLDARARRFLYRMTVLRTPADWTLLGLLGEADEPEAQTVATAERLRDTSLLKQMELRVPVSQDRSATRTRYGLHPATERFILAVHPEAPALLLAAHRRLGERLEAEAKDSPYIDARIEAGHHLLAAGEYDRAFKLLGDASQWLQDHGRVREGLALLVPFLEESVQVRMDPKWVGRLLGTLGLFNHRLGEITKAIGHYKQALENLREIGDRRGEGTSLGNLGLAYADLGEVTKAIGYYEQQLVITREIGDRHGEGNAHGNLGLAYADLGEVMKAIGYYEQQLVIVREIGDRRGEGNAHGNLGSAYLRLGEVKKAISYDEQWLAIAREIGDRHGESAALVNLGNAYANLGGFMKAIGYYGQALVIMREIGDRRGEDKALGNLGFTYAELGEVTKAIGYYEQQLIIAREIGDRHGEGAVLGNLGVAYNHLGEVTKAIGYYEQQLVIVREISDRRGEGAALGNLGIAYAHLCEVEKAQALLRQAKAIGEQIRDPHIIRVTSAALEELSAQG